LIFSNDSKLGDAVIEGLTETLDDGGLVEVLFALAGPVFLSSDGFSMKSARESKLPAGCASPGQHNNRGLLHLRIGWPKNTKTLRRIAPVLKSPEIGTLCLLCTRVLSVSLVEGHN
jgi:hypothetical protein